MANVNTFGATQLALLDQLAREGAISADTERERHALLKLHDRGLVERKTVYTLTDKGKACLINKK